MSHHTYVYTQLWTLAFIGAVGQLVLSMAFSIWFFRRDKSTLGCGTRMLFQTKLFFYELIHHYTDLGPTLTDTTHHTPVAHHVSQFDLCNKNNATVSYGKFCFCSTSKSLLPHNTHHFPYWPSLINRALPLLDLLSSQYCNLFERCVCLPTLCAAFNSDTVLLHPDTTTTIEENPFHGCPTILAQLPFEKKYKLQL